MIAPEPFLEPRGTPISVYRRIQALTALGHRVDLLTYPQGDSVELPGLAIHRIPRLPWVKDVRIGASWAKVVLDAMLFCKASGMLLTGKYDVIHSHEEAAYFSTPLALLFRTPHVYDMHSSLPSQLAGVAGWNGEAILAVSRALEKWTIRSSDAVIVVSEALEQVARGICGNANCRIIENLPAGLGDAGPHGSHVDALRDRLGLRDRVPVVYTGTLEPYQGIDLLVGSAGAVAESCPEVVFLIVGGTDRQVADWRREVELRGLNEHVWLEGRVPLDTVGAYLHVAEILVSPRGPSMPIPSKIYSYMQAAKPIVATDIESHRQVLGRDAAVLVEPTSEAFARALVRLIRAPEARQRLRESVERLHRDAYDPEQYRARLGEVYGTLQDKGGSRVRHLRRRVA